MGKGEDTNDFNKNGPSHITKQSKPIDWANLEDRTAVLASLVNGVYTLEEDRLKKRVGPESLAAPWWESFHFTEHETWKDKDSIYGAVFKYRDYHLFKNTTDVKVPCYVIAFRGTVLKKHTWKSDVKLNLKIIFNGLHRGRRPEEAIQSIRRMVDEHKGSPIWLAGHSLGAAIALLVGKSLAVSSFCLESYIFNPPIIWSIPSEQLYHIKDIFHFGKTVVKAIAFAGIEGLLGKKIPEDDPNLAAWIPYLYVNPADPVCAGSVYYFRRYYYFKCKPRESQINRKIAKAVRSLFFGKKKSESSTSGLSREPLHHLVSADVTINKNERTESFGGHALQQWWQKDSSQKWERLHIRPRRPGETRNNNF